MDYLNQENYWRETLTLSQAASVHFGYDLKVRAFENRQFAVFDLCMGLLSFLSHRPKVAFVRQGSSLIDTLLPQLYRQQTALIFKEQQDSYLHFIEKLDNEVNFVLWTAKHELTRANIFSDDEKFDFHKKLSAKRIFSIEVVNRLSDLDLKIIKECSYSVILQSGSLLTPEKTLILHTDRLKTFPLIAQMQNLFETRNDLQKTMNFSEHMSEDQVLLNLKNTNPNLKLKLNQNVLVIESEKVSGSSLKSKLGLSNDLAFATSELPITILESFVPWWPEVSNQSYTRGLLIIDLQRLKSKIDLLGFEQQIAQAFDELTASSTWSIDV